MTESVHRFRSEQLGNERTIWVREPNDAARPSQLIIFLDGELYRERVEAITVIHELEAESAIGRTLAVFVSVESWEARWKECPCFPPFAHFVSDELLPWIEAHWPVSKGRGDHVLAGLSYTGLAAAFVALKSPGKFGRIIAQSGSFWSDSCWLVGPFANLATPLPTAFYLDVGTRETATNVQHREGVLQVMSQIDGVRKFRDVLIGKGHPVKYLEFDGGHDFAAWKNTLPEALRWALPVTH